MNFTDIPSFKKKNEFHWYGPGKNEEGIHGNKGWEDWRRRNVNWIGFSNMGWRYLEKEEEEEEVCAL